MTATSHDVARLAGVSQPTVSRALRGDPRVAEPTRAKVLAAAAQLGYIPSELGRSLSTRSTRQIAMVADLRNALYPALVAPLHDAFADHGLRMVLLAERGEEEVTYDRLLDRSVDGVVLTTTSIGSPLSAALLDRGLPFVELNRVSGLAGADGVSADNDGGARAATQLLLDAGHRRLAAIVGSPTSSTGREREAGFLAALAEAGASGEPGLVAHGGFGYLDGERGLAQVMSADPPPTAVFCGGDLIAVGALNQARRMGLAVPDDVAIVGFDDIDMASWPAFDLTTVRVDLDGMAIAAADRLVAQLGGEAAGGEALVFGTELVLRSTHG